MLQRPQVILLGCFHQAQPPPVPNCFWNEHRIAFAEVVATLVTTLQIKFVGEEAEQSMTSSAALIANQRQIRYANIDIPLSVQKSIKLHPSHGIDPVTNRYTNYRGCNRYVDAWDNVREYHMYQTFLDVFGGDSPSLLICGTAHQDGFKRLLERQFEIVPKTFEIDKEMDTWRFDE
jgi:hypothetical protein